MIGFLEYAPSAMGDILQNNWPGLLRTSPTEGRGQNLNPEPAALTLSGLRPFSWAGR